MNILLGVYACEPYKGSEPEVGWQMVNEMAKILPEDNIYAITRANNKEIIETTGYPKNIQFFYYDVPKWLSFWKKKSRGARIYAYIWMIGAALYVKRKKLHFDIVQHITFVNDWVPSSYHMLKTKYNKFIWGPIGSHDPIDVKFLNGIKEKTIEKIRIFLQLFFRNIDPSFYLSKKKADCIIGINDNVKNKLKLKENKRFLSEPAIAIKKSEVSKLEKIENRSSKFTILSVGRLIYIKNFRLTLLSFAKFLNNQLNSTEICLKIIGDGADIDILKSLSKDLGIHNNVQFIGQIARSEVQKNFEHADLFLFPTLESAGFVILEAMSHSLPVLAMNYGGPKQYIKHFTNEQLVSSKDSYDEIATSLANKLENLYQDKNLRNTIGIQNKIDVINSFTWEAKALKMKKLYKELLNES